MQSPESKGPCAPGLYFRCLLKDDLDQMRSQLSNVQNHLDLARPDVAEACTIENTLNQALAKLNTETQAMRHEMSARLHIEAESLATTMARITSEGDRMKQEADRQANEAKNAKAAADRMATEADRAAREKQYAAEEWKSLKKQLKKLDAKCEAMNVTQPQSVKGRFREV